MYLNYNAYVSYKNIDHHKKVKHACVNRIKKKCNSIFTINNF